MRPGTWSAVDLINSVVELTFSISRRNPREKHGPGSAVATSGRRASSVVIASRAVYSAIFAFSVGSICVSSWSSSYPRLHSNEVVGRCKLECLADTMSRLVNTSYARR